VNTDNGKVFATSPGFEQSQVVSALKELGKGRHSDGRFVTKEALSFPLAVVVEKPEHSLLDAWPALLSAWCLSGAIAGIGCGALVLRSFARALSLEGELSRAVRRRDFEVHYQPIVDLRDGRCVGAEALVRWRRGAVLVAPDKFIPVAEGSGLIQAITDEVLRIVVSEMHDTFLKDEQFFVSINVSARDMCTARFLDVITNVLAKTGIRSSQVRIEVTEREIIDKNSCLEMMRAFREAGHLVYIDDFGTGYSNLSYLEDFAVDILKIDRTFTRAIGERAATSDVTRHIVAMAKALGLAVVAEGIETIEQAHYLGEIGVEYGQGWLFAPGRPLPGFQQYLATQGSVHGPGRPSMMPSYEVASSA
jgi:sensor c-di-GMP phosphodiesterase-like protein